MTTVLLTSFDFTHARAPQNSITPRKLTPREKLERVGCVNFHDKLVLAKSHHAKNAYGGACGGKPLGMWLAKIKHGKELEMRRIQRAHDLKMRRLERKALKLKERLERKTLKLKEHLERKAHKKASKHKKRKSSQRKTNIKSLKSLPSFRKM